MYDVHPGPCWICHRGFGQMLCAHCWPLLPFIPYPQSCSLCAQPALWIDHRCADCRENPPPFDQLIVGQDYRWPWTQWVPALKFRREAARAHLLAHTLALSIQKHLQEGRFSLPDLLIPVPLHPRRLQERGYNQAEKIAKPLSVWLDRPVDRLSLQRLEYTRAQSRLSAVERAHNVKEAFVLTIQKSSLPLENTHVGLVDDVVTTFSTVNAISRVLKEAGVARITILSGCRV